MSAEAFLKQEVQRFLKNLTEVHCLSTCSKEVVDLTWVFVTILVLQLCWGVVGVGVRWLHVRRRLLILTPSQKFMAVFFSTSHMFSPLLETAPVDPGEPAPLELAPVSPDSSPAGIGERIVNFFIRRFNYLYGIIQYILFILFRRNRNEV